MLRKTSSGSVRVKGSDEKERDEVLFIGTLGINCIEYTRRCISSVQTSCKHVRFVYVDNGSSDKNVVELKKLKKKNPDIDVFHLGFNGRNAGVAVGWNQLIKMAIDDGATKILICNNDIHFGPFTIDGMVDAYNQIRKHDPRTVMVTATNHTKIPSQLQGIRQEWKNHEHPDFSCFMVTPETIDRVGYFNEDYDPAFFEDNDMHWRILLMGYKAYGTDWAPYSHVASRTRHENPNIVPHLRFRENKLKFFRNMLTDTVDQEVANERYAAWVKDHPTQPHPAYTDVLMHAKSIGLIDEKLLKRINSFHPTRNWPG